MVDDWSTTGVRETLAANLRRLRIARHLSLSELARATGMSKATLSSIENARANPTVETLASLADALRISLRELLEEVPLGDIRIVRATGAEAKSLDGLPQRVLETLADDGALRVAELVLPARHLHEIDSKRAGTRAHVYVVQGKLLAGPVERVTELAPGDYASFPADVPHVYETERQPVKALLLLQGGA